MFNWKGNCGIERGDNCQRNEIETVSLKLKLPQIMKERVEKIQASLCGEHGDFTSDKEAAPANLVRAVPGKLWTALN